MWAQRIAPLDELAAARSLSAELGFAWLDSHRSDPRDGRYSFLAAWPEEEICVPFGSTSPFSALENIGQPAETVNLEGPKPSAVPQWIGYIAYDAFWSSPIRGAPRFERSRDPILFFRRYPALLAIDHLDGNAWVVGDDERACTEFRRRLERCDNTTITPPTIGTLQVDDAEQHRSAIVRALDYIARGDVYEVNLARRWAAKFDGSAFGLWQAMRDASRVPLGMFLDAGERAILACTMERFVRWHPESRTLVTRPIKGTIRRDPGDDEAPERLRTDPKERAEHSMIVDLMRNDLGRVAETGSVTVDTPLGVEPFTGLYHLVTTVSCVTRPETTLPSILRATFPPGSITGAPKLRAIEIIEELEQHARGVYCGALGFIDRDGGLSLAVAIRTATVQAGEVHYWAGGGIVEASDPGREVTETNLKARVFTDAIASLRSGLEHISSG